MIIKKGIPVSHGVAIFPATVLDSEGAPIPRRTVGVDRIGHELDRLEDALVNARAEIESVRRQVEQDLGPEPAKIFGFHLGMLLDPTLTDQITKMIEEETVTAEYAADVVLRNIGKTFLQQQNPLFRERVSDVWDVHKRLLKHLLGESHAGVEHMSEDHVIVAYDLTPSETVGMDRKHVRGIATDAGGATSHTAIVAKALGIPAIVGLGDATAEVSPGDMVIVDGDRGLLIINPDQRQLHDYRAYAERVSRFEHALDELAELPAITVDGTEISLLANMEFPEEVPIARDKGAAGVGLYRTEFLFMAGETEPDEEQQYAAFKEALDLLGDLPMTLRTFDLGADKYTQLQALAPERNPFLGCRSIRYCLQNLSMFKTHLRAILRASALKPGQMRIMFPLVTNIMELRQARMIMNDVMEDLDDQGIPYDHSVKIGIMIEVPSAALTARAFTEEVDFFSIGTNDLIQYTLAVDRVNERVAKLYSPGEPAVLRLIQEVIRAAQHKQVDVSCCGEMAGDVEFVMLLLGMGLRKLSMTPQAIPAVKKLIRSVTIEQCEMLARRVAAYDSEIQVTNYLREETRKVIPEAFHDRWMN